MAHLPRFLQLASAVLTLTLFAPPAMATVTVRVAEGAALAAQRGTPAPDHDQVLGGEILAEIPEGPTSEGVDTVAGSTIAGTIVDLDIEVDITHPHVGDLLIRLEHVGFGGPFDLMDRPLVPEFPTGCNEDNVDVIFDDAASSPVESACENSDGPGTAAVTGRLRPNDALASFVGDDAQGRWRLTAVDVRTGATGVLNSWSLHLQVARGGDDIGIISESAAAYPSIDPIIVNALYGTGGLDTITTMDLSQRVTPLTVADLARFDSILVYQLGRVDGAPPSPFDDELGDLLAAYVAQGGGVVLAQPSYVGGGLGGNRSGVWDGPPGPISAATSPLGRHDAAHPLLAGVSEVVAHPSAVDVAPGARIVASYSTGEPLAVTRATTAGRIVGLNLVPYPVTDPEDLAGYELSSDGRRLIVNALRWAATPVPLCQGRAPTHEGSAGADTLAGSAGDDVMIGLAGDDRIVPGGGDDLVCAGQGADTMVFRTRRDLSVNLASGKASGQGDDTFVDVEHVIGGRGSDELRGNRGPNRLVGGRGADRLFGAGGADTLAGGRGVDTADGGRGNDTCDAETTRRC